MKTKRFVAAALALAAAAQAGELAGLEGTDGQRRTADQLTADRPALVLITTPRLADVGAQLRYLSFLAAELADEAAVVAVVYGEEAATLAKFREGMRFPIVGGAGKPPEGTFGTAEKPKTSVVWLADTAGNVREKRTDIPDPLAAAQTLDLKYDGGAEGPPRPGEALPALTLAASRGAPSDLRAHAQLHPKTLIFVFDKEDRNRANCLADLQVLADDLGDDMEVVAAMTNATAAEAAKIAESQKLDMPVYLAGPLAARRLVGDLTPPVLIMAEEHATVVGVKEKARAPSFVELAAEESAPASEGEPITLAVKRVMPLTPRLKSDAVPVAAWDASGRNVIYHGHYAPGEPDHLYEVAAFGGKTRQVSYAAAPDVAPVCSSDGVHVAFTSARSGGNEIWTCEQVHGEFTQITKSGGAFFTPAYSADGRWLVAVKKVRAGEGYNTDLWYLSARGRRLRPVAETFDDEAEPAFATEGDRVFFAGRRDGEWDILSADLKGGGKKRLTDAGSEDRMPAPSPDGKVLVYASRTASEPFKLWAMNVDGSSKVALTDGPGNDLYPRFSPDGLALVFASDRGGSFEIYKMTFEATPDYNLPRPSRPIAWATR